MSHIAGQVGTVSSEAQRTSSTHAAHGHVDVRIARIPADHPSNETSVLDLMPLGAEGQLSRSVWAGHGRQMVGWGEAYRLSVQGQNSIRSAARRWDEIRQNAQVTCMCSPECDKTQMPALPVAFASFGFARGAEGFLTVPEVAIIELPVTPETTVQTPTVATALPTSRWGFPWGGWGSARGPRFIVTAAWVPSLTEVEDASSLPQGAADPWAVLDALGAGECTAAPALDELSFDTLPGRMTQQQWTEQVAHVIQALQAGAAQKVVMSRDMIVRASQAIDQTELVRRLASLYPTTWVYAVGGLVGATPEMLAAMHDQQVYSRVLAGTIAPGRGAELMHSMKDRTEHMFAVESVARALGPMSSSLDVPESPMVLDLPNVSHLATDVAARLDSGNIIDVVAALHPTAAVCGTPTSHAYDLLDEYEQTQRGRYSGPVGWVDGAGEGEFGIALRCGQLSADSLQIRLFAGGGIMPDSVPEMELAETRAKMAPVLQALGVDASV